MKEKLFKFIQIYYSFKFIQIYYSFKFIQIYYLLSLNNLRAHIIDGMTEFGIELVTDGWINCAFLRQFIDGDRKSLRIVLPERPITINVHVMKSTVRVRQEFRNSVHQFNSIRCGVSEQIKFKLICRVQ